MAIFTTLETPRLRLRYFKDADLALFMGYRNDPEVARYQSWEGISETEAYAFLQEQKDSQTSRNRTGVLDIGRTYPL